MTELYQAYGGMEDNMASRLDDLPEHAEHRGERHDTRPDPRQEVEQRAVHKKERRTQEAPRMAQQAQQRVVENFQSSANFEESLIPEYAPKHQRRTPSYSFWDRMTIKRSEVVKLAVFSLVIVLAISLDRMGTHYLSKYLSDNVFTDFQEFMLRLSYPVMIFLVLWIIKSL